MSTSTMTTFRSGRSGTSARQKPSNSGGKSSQSCSFQRLIISRGSAAPLSRRLGILARNHIMIASAVLEFLVHDGRHHQVAPDVDGGDGIVEEAIHHQV